MSILNIDTIYNSIKDSINDKISLMEKGKDVDPSFVLFYIKTINELKSYLIESLTPEMKVNIHNHSIEEDFIINSKEYNIEKVLEDYILFKKDSKTKFDNYLNSLISSIEEVTESISKNYSTIIPYIKETSKDILSKLDSFIEHIKYTGNKLDTFTTDLYELRKNYLKSITPKATYYAPSERDISINKKGLYVDLYTDKDMLIKTLIKQNLNVIEKSGSLYIERSQYSKDPTIWIHTIPEESLSLEEINSGIIKTDKLYMKSIDKVSYNIDQIVETYDITIYTSNVVILEEYDKILEFAKNKLKSDFGDLYEAECIIHNNSYIEVLEHIEDTDIEKAILLFEFDKTMFEHYFDEFDNIKFRNRISLFVESLQKEIRYNNRKIELDFNRNTIYFVIYE